MLTRRQVAAADARDELSDIWSKLEVLEEKLKGHMVKGKLYQLAFTGIHTAISLLVELLKIEVEKEQPDDTELR